MQLSVAAFLANLNWAMTDVAIVVSSSEAPNAASFSSSAAAEVVKIFKIFPSQD